MGVPDTTLTTTVTFADLIAHYDDELDDLREAHEDILAAIREEFGEDAISEAVPEDTADDDKQYLASLQQTANLYNQSAKAIQKRQHVLETIGERWDGDTFELTMLTGGELSDLETELRMEAHRRDVPVEMLQAERQRRVADAAVVDGPEAMPRDDEGSPQPSECPNPLTLSLYELAEELNQQGGLDFTPAGFGDMIGTGSPSSASPINSRGLSSDSAPTADSTPPPGESSSEN